MQQESDVLYEGLHRLALVTKEVIDFGEYESRNVTGPSFVNGIAKQPMIGRILDEVLEQSISIADQCCFATGGHGTAPARRRALLARARFRRFAA
jgi:hypothetical protein